MPEPRSNASLPLGRIFAIVIVTALVAVLILAFWMYERATRGEWIVAWSTSWTGPESQKPVSRDGRYAYFTTRKFINITGGGWGRGWRSPDLRGRVDLTTGDIETGVVPGGMRMVGLAGYLLAETVAIQLKADSIPFFWTGPNVRHHSYGDGRYFLLLNRSNEVSSDFTAFLLDNEDTYRVIGRGFTDGWVSTDEKSVVLVKNSGDTWVYDIGSRKLRMLVASDEVPRFLRGLQDLSEDARIRASAAMGRHCAERRYRRYPVEEAQL